MSTKIYDAYKYGKSLQKLIKELKKIRTAELDRAAQAIARSEQFIDQCPWLTDSQNIPVMETDDEASVDKKRQSIHSVVMALLRKEMSSGLRTELNFSSAAAVFADDGDLYIQFFGFAGDTSKLMKHLTDFHYQTSTDKPAGISTKDWEKRRKVWDRMVPSGIPREDGLVFSFVNIDDCRLLASKAIELYKLSMQAANSNAALQPADAGLQKA